jgi:hypothetical protein
LKLRVPSREIPQADLLEDVLACARIVSKGGTVSYQEIATMLRKTDRQGRYYRRAAEILGLIESAGKNSSRLTPLGDLVLAADEQQRRNILSQRLARLTIFQIVLQALANSGGSMDRTELEQLLRANTTLVTREMRHRRLKTILSWLVSVRLARESDNLVSLR